MAGLKNLEKFGFSEWFENQLEPEKLTAHELARVVSVHRDRYVINNGDDEAFAELAGALFYTSDNPEDLPTTGDWVYADFYDDNTHAIIHSIIPRKSLLRRKAAGKIINYQLIAANIDVAFIIQSANENLNLRRLERYLVMVNECGITPVVLLSKSDLRSENEIEDLKVEIAGIAHDVLLLTFSNLTAANIDFIKNSLLPGFTYCLIGSSGVGKTTLLNSLLGDDIFSTQSVSKKHSKGRHTTTNRELIRLECGALIIDTPGMRELGSLSVDSGIDETFSEIIGLSNQCKFADCSHQNEKGCAIQAAIKNGELSDQRFKNYLKMKKESAFNDLSYSEKRKRDKDFGKMINATIKNKLR